MSFHELCTKFWHSIMFIIKIVLYAATLAVFFLLFSIDNPEIISLSTGRAFGFDQRDIYRSYHLSRTVDHEDERGKQYDV